MGGHVNQDMQTPGPEFTEWPFQEEPNQQKREEKHDETMGDIVQMVHILRDRRFWRSALTEIGLLCQTEHACRPQNPERKEVRCQADHEGQPKTQSTLPTEGNRAPETVGNNIHPTSSSRVAQLHLRPLT